MARPPRLDPEDGLHHVWNRGVARQATFFADSDRIEFGSQLGAMHDQFGIETYAYCLMDNHFHLLLHCPKGGLSDGMQQLGGHYTRHVNDRLGRDGPIFRGRFRSRVVLTEDYLVGLVRYIHRNALDVRGVDSVEHYRWSSHRAYLGARREPPWLRTAPVLEYFGGDRAALHEFVARNPADGQRTLTPADIHCFVAAADAIVCETLGDGADAARMSRTLVLLAIEHHAVDSGVVVRELGYRSQAALRTARSRAQARRRDRPEFARLAARVAQLALGARPPRQQALHVGSDP